MGQRLAAEGYAVLVPNPFYRLGRPPMPDWPLDFGSDEGRERAMGLVRSPTPERVAADARTFLEYLDGQAQVDPGRRAGVQGYCMGGPMAFRTAALLPGRVGAMASFHGGGLVTTAPDSPHRLVPEMRAKALVAVAGDDDAKDPGARPALEAAFQEAGLPARVELFAGEGHGWCVPDSHTYNHEAAERAWAELLELYRRALV